MENAEASMLQGKSQGPLKFSANTLSHSEEMLSCFLSASKERIALMKTPGISLSNSSNLDKEFSNLLEAKDDGFVLIEINSMLGKAHFYLEGVLNSKKPLLCADPKGMCTENEIIPALKILEKVLFEWIVGKRVENSL